MSPRTIETTEADELVTSITGSTDRLGRHLDRGERVYLVIEAKVGALHLVPEKITRTLVLTDAFELDGDEGRRIVNTLRTARSVANQVTAGREILPGLEGLTDVSGVVDVETIAGIRTGDPTADDGPDGAAYAFDPELEAAAALLFERGLDDLLTADLDTIRTSGRIDGLSPRALRALITVETVRGHRGDLLDELDERLAAALAGLVTEVPWAGYAGGSISSTIQRLMEAREALEADGTWLDLLEHVHAYEASRKARAGILDYCTGELGPDFFTTPGPDDEPIPPAAGLELEDTADVATVPEARTGVALGDDAIDVIAGAIVDHDADVPATPPLPGEEGAPQ